MKRNLYRIVGLALSLMLVATGCAAAAEEAFWPGLALAAQQVCEDGTLRSWLLEDTPPDAAVQAALDAVLEAAVSVASAGALGRFDFPLLEVENAAIRWQSVKLHGPEGEACRIIGFFPERIPQMAACAAVSDAGEVLAVFHGSTWMMARCWEDSLGLAEHFWSVEMCYAFHRLFEAEDMQRPSGLPSPQDLTQTEACVIAEEALLRRGLIRRVSELSACRAGVQYRLQTDGHGMWLVQYYDRQSQTLLFWVEIDAASGEVLAAMGNTDGHG